MNERQVCDAFGSVYPAKGTVNNSSITFGRFPGETHRGRDSRPTLAEVQTCEMHTWIEQQG